MKQRRFAFIAALIAVCLLGYAVPQRADADVSDLLRQVLRTLRGLGPQPFSYVVRWAAAGAPQVYVPIQDYEQAEAQILNLGGADRQAVLSWLQGNGRGALYGRRDYGENCVTLTNGLAAVPILTARYATYRVREVNYADGSSWRPTAQ